MGSFLGWEAGRGICLRHVGSFRVTTLHYMGFDVHIEGWGGTLYRPGKGDREAGCF